MSCRWLLILICLQSAAVPAEDLLMVRSPESFPEAMLSLQQAIRERGYTISRVQRVDIGLTASGFSTDRYRVVFFGRPQQVRDLSRRFPQLIPYLPLKAAIFAEGEETLVVATNPVKLGSFYTEPELQRVFAQWEKDLRVVFEQVRITE